jgi:peroxiredoxin Q/BCP
MSLRPLAAAAAVVLAGVSVAPASAVPAAAVTQADRPSVGSPAPDFETPRLDGSPLRLSDLTKDGSVALLILRGWIGYQCPVCTRQVGDFLGRAADFQAAGASVVMVYPGDSSYVRERAGEFITGKTLPARYHYVQDPDRKIVNLYGVRWTAPDQHAYPSTFVIDRQGTTRFAYVGRNAGDRPAIDDVLAAVRRAESK